MAHTFRSLAVTKHWWPHAAASARSMYALQVRDGLSMFVVGL